MAKTTQMIFAVTALEQLLVPRVNIYELTEAVYDVAEKTIVHALWDGHCTCVHTFVRFFEDFIQALFVENCFKCTKSLELQKIYLRGKKILFINLPSLQLVLLLRYKMLRDIHLIPNSQFWNNLWYPSSTTQIYLLLFHLDVKCFWWLWKSFLFSCIACCMRMACEVKPSQDRKTVITFGDKVPWLSKNKESDLGSTRMVSLIYCAHLPFCIEWITFKILYLKSGIETGLGPSDISIFGSI